jgi:hypothetical protein
MLREGKRRRFNKTTRLGAVAAYNKQRIQNSVPPNALIIFFGVVFAVPVPGLRLEGYFLGDKLKELRDVGMS